MTPEEQAAFRTYLAGEGYDSTNGELIENETIPTLLDKRTGSPLAPAATK